MTENKKTYTIEINGVEQAYENVCLLKDALIDLEVIAKTSKLSQAMSNVFGSISGMETAVKSFDKTIDKLAVQIEGLNAVVKTIGTVQKALSGEKKEENEGEKKEEATPKTPVSTPTPPKKETALTPEDERIAILTKNVSEGLKKVLDEASKEAKEDKIFYQKLLDAIKTTLGKGVVEEKKENTQDQTPDAEKKQSKTEPVKKEEKAIGKNFGLDGLTLDDKKFKAEKVTNSDGTTNVDETRKKLRGLKKEIKAYEDELKSIEKISNTFFTELLKKHENNAEEKKAIELAQAEFDAQLETQKQDARKKGSEIDKILNDNTWKSMVDTHDAMKKVWDEYNSYAMVTLDKGKDYYAKNKELYIAEADELKKEITAIDTKLTESTNRRKSLLEEDKKASGGRSVVIKEQLAREMEAQQDLTKQKTELSKKEADLRKKAEKEEKRSKRMEIISGAAKATANVAMGIAKELSKGLLGIPTALVIAAQGAIQIATIKKQLDKINLEDGGLLRGKRHVQGGMRIEGTNIEVEGDEYVVNRISTRKNLGLIDYINKSRRELAPSDIYSYYGNRSNQQYTENRYPVKRMLEEGGQLTNLNVISGFTTQSAEDKMLDAISKINFRPVVSVVDITNAQETIASVKQIAGV